MYFALNIVSERSYNTGSQYTKEQKRIYDSSIVKLSLTKGGINAFLKLNDAFTTA